MCTWFSLACAQGEADSTDLSGKLLHQVVVEGRQTPVVVSGTQPRQELKRSQIELIGLTNMADAVKHFAGANVRDYGGVGGMKTVSVRNLGAHHTAVSYDGITVSNTQAGQIDIGRFSLDNVESISFSIGQADDPMQSARHLASAGLLSIETERPKFGSDKRHELRARIDGGSFGLFNPSMRFYHQWNESTLLSLDANYLHSDGKYPFTLVNGSRRTQEHRNNTDIDAFHAEANIYHTMADSSTLDVKAYWFRSDRGLPGAVILYNNVSHERLNDEDFFSQAVWRKHILPQLQLHTRLKYTHSWSKYEDTGVKYVGGHTEEINRQDEYYASATLGWQPFNALTLAVAEDLSVNTLRTNITQGNNLKPLKPRRITSLTAFTAHLTWHRWKVNASLLGTYANEEVKNADSPSDRHRLSPSVALNYRLLRNEPLFARLMFKSTFRMPSFNDLYYLRMGSSALRPECAREYNAGITWFHSNRGIVRGLSLTADVYYNDVRDKIVAFPSTYVWKMANFGKVHIAGIDVTAASEVATSRTTSLSLQAAYTFQKTEDRLKNSPSYGKQLPYTPQHNGSATVLWNTPWVNVGYSLIACGQRWSMAQNTPQYRLHSYMEHSLTLSRDFKIRSAALKVQASVQNLTDEQYEIIRYYPMPGRNFRVSATLKL